MTSSLGPKHPFPGLRPYTGADHEWFFGRAEQSLSLYRLLSHSRLVTVLGGSGSGKSSLVGAGLLPLLAEETATEGARRWRSWELSPAEAPIARLGEVLCGALADDADDAERAAYAARRERLDFLLRKSSFGLVDALREVLVEPGTTPLILVDQFEELFRFANLPGNKAARARRREEASAFVQLLLEATRSATDLEVRVVLTVRSDYFADFALFHGLPEAVSRGEFLVNSLTRDQREQAIRGPIAKAGASIADELVERLLNDSSDEPDQLAVLQHALMRTWSHSADGEPSRLSLADYEAIGGVSSAISQHANELLEEPELRDLGLAVEQVFRALAELDRQERATRRPLTYSQLVAESAVPEADVRTVVDRFRRDDCSFLVPALVDQQPLDAEQVVDIGHEVLIRRWVRMTCEDDGERRGWVFDEASDGRAYAALLNIARGAASAEVATLPLDQVRSRAAWWQSRPRTSTWADRYGGDFDSVEKLVSDSTARLAQVERQQTRAKRRWWTLISSVLIGGIVLPLLALLYWQFQVAREQGDVAQLASANAVRALAELQAEKQRAQRNASQALEQRAIADKLREVIQQQVTPAEAEASGTEVQAVGADKARQLTPSRQVAAASLTERSDGLARALLRRVAVMHIRDTPEARSSLLRSLQRVVRVPHFLWGHEASVLSVAYSPDGKLLASASFDGRVILWDTAKRKSIGRPLTGHKGPVSQVAFSPDGDTLASAGVNELIFWDVVRGRKLGTVPMGHDLAAPKTVEPGGDAIRLAFSPQGKFLVAGSRNNVLLIDVERRRQLSVRFTGHEDNVRSVAVSPNGKIVAAGTDRQVRLWDLASGSPLAGWPKRLSGRVDTVVFSPNGKMLASAGDDKNIILWDLATAKQIAGPLKGHQEGVTKLAFSPDGRTLASASLDQRVILWNVASRTPLKEPLVASQARVLSVTFSPGGDTLAAASADNRITLWDLTGRSVLNVSVAGHTGPVTSVAFSPDSRILASGGRDQRIVLWDRIRREFVGKPLSGHQNGVSVLAFSPDGKTLVSGSLDNSAMLWNVATQKQVGQLRGVLKSLALSRDGKILAATGDGRRVVLWDVVNAKPIDKPPVYSPTEIRAAAFSADGKTLALVGSGKGILLLDVAKGSHRVALTQVPQSRTACVAFSPDGTKIAVCVGGQRVILWDLLRHKRTGELVRGHLADVSGVAFSPDNELLATTGSDGRVILWDLVTHKQLGDPLLGHAKNAGAGVTFSPNGEFLAAAGRDGRVLLWNVSAEYWANVACGIAGRNLSRREWRKDVGKAVPYAQACPQFPLPRG